MVDAAVNAVRRALEQMEGAAEPHLQDLVGTEVFSEMLAHTMGTVMGIARIRNDLFEQALHTARVPTQSDLTRLGRQVNRLDDKMELLLQALERIEDRLDAVESEAPKPARRPARRRTAAA